MKNDKLYITVEFTGLGNSATNTPTNSYSSILSFGYFGNSTPNKTPPIFYTSDWVVSENQLISEFVKLIEKEILPRLMETGYQKSIVNSIVLFRPFTSSEEPLDQSMSFKLANVVNGDKIRIT